MQDSQSNEILMHIISANLQSAREYRQMAKEFMNKADHLEATMLQVAMKIKEMEKVEIEEVLKTSGKPSAGDVFDSFDDMFSGKKKGPSK